MESHHFTYDLPAQCIAQAPVEPRDHSKLMVVHRKTRKVTHAIFRDLPDLLPEKMLLVRNNAAVLPARLFGKLPTGGKVECLLLRPGENRHTFYALVKPARKCPPGAYFMGEDFTVAVKAAGNGGERLLEFALARDDSVVDLARRCGKMPLPPYIRRTREDDRDTLDRERYQTVFAAPEKTVAAAAPTAGLHFTAPLLKNLEEQGHRFTDVTLHIGTGTFQPIQTDRLQDHIMHREWYEIPAQTVQDIKQARAAKTPICAIGTTAVRSLEDFARRSINADIHPTEGAFAAEADLFLYPPVPFHLTDALITNFHLPRSTLLCLLAAFLEPQGSHGVTWWKELYEEALRKNYRFFSYGDAMLIL